MNADNKNDVFVSAISNIVQQKLTKQMKGKMQMQENHINFAHLEGLSGILRNLAFYTFTRAIADYMLEPAQAFEREEQLTAPKKYGWTMIVGRN